MIVFNQDPIEESDAMIKASHADAYFSSSLILDLFRVSSSPTPNLSIILTYRLAVVAMPESLCRKLRTHLSTTRI